MYICPCHSLTSSQLTLPPPHVLKSILYVCVFIPVLPLGSSVPFFFFRFHMYVLAYCICFSLSDLLHSVWQTLGPSTSLQITQFCFEGSFWVIFSLMLFLKLCLRRNDYILLYLYPRYPYITALLPTLSYIWDPPSVSDGEGPPQHPSSVSPAQSIKAGPQKALGKHLWWVFEEAILD